MTHEQMMLLPASKERAEIANSKYYFTNSACRRGHLSYRYTSSSNCVQCIADKRGRHRIFPNYKPKASPENQQKAHDALESGFSVYAPLKPCKRGHFLRYATTHNCVDCGELSQKNDSEKRWRRIQQVYGVSKDQFYKMLISQECKCAICKLHISDKNCHVDHCHKRNIVRGLLCQKCNQGIGLFGDDVATLMSAIKYIESSK